MAKFIPYESPLAFLARKFRFIKKPRSLYFKYNKFDEKLNVDAQDPRPFLGPNFLGGLHPILAIAKDLTDSYKPYKAAYYAQRDLLQPLRGLGNVLRGVANVITAPLIFLISVGRYVAIGVEERNFALFLYNMTLGFLKAGGGFLDGINSIIRGIMQFVTTPLNWFIRMPLRGIITAVQGLPTVHHNLEKRILKLDMLINQDDKTLEDTILIDSKMQAIWNKIEKAELRGQNIGVEYEEADRRFKACQKFTRICLRAPNVLKNRTFKIVFEGPEEYHSNDTPTARARALSFLSLFKAGEENPIMDGVALPTDTQSFVA